MEPLGDGWPSDGTFLGLDVRLYRMRGCYDPAVPPVGSDGERGERAPLADEVEPDEYSIDDLKRDGTTPWEGVRNYQARNFMRDTMVVGDRVLFYHSSCKVPGVAGIAEVTRAAYPDPPRREIPRIQPTIPARPTKTRGGSWSMSALSKYSGGYRWRSKADPALEGMLVTRRGQRLSVRPVSPEHLAPCGGVGAFPLS